MHRYISFKALNPSMSKNSQGQVGVLQILRTFWGAKVRGPPLQVRVVPSSLQFNGSILIGVPEIQVALSDSLGMISLLKYTNWTKVQ